MVLEKIEKKLGLPSLKEVSETLQKFPDAKQLELIRQVLEVAERVAKTGPELANVLGIIKELNSMPVEKLENLEKVLKRIESIIRKAPEELVNFLSGLKGE